MSFERVQVVTIVKKDDGTTGMGLVQTERQKIAALGLIMGENWAKEQFKTIEKMSWTLGINYLERVLNNYDRNNKGLKKGRLY